MKKKINTVVCKILSWNLIYIGKFASKQTRSCSAKCVSGAVADANLAAACWWEQEEECTAPHITHQLWTVSHEPCERGSANLSSPLSNNAHLSTRRAAGMPQTSPKLPISGVLCAAPSLIRDATRTTPMLHSDAQLITSRGLVEAGERMIGSLKLSSPTSSVRMFESSYYLLTSSYGCWG